MIFVSAGLVLCPSASANGTHTYYVSPIGDDGNDGLSPGSPWRSVGKVNGSTFNPGDSVLFQRGGQWRESLVVPSSGAQGNPITFADYGNGAKPKFWGSVVLDNSQFQALGEGIYSYPMSTTVYSVLANHGFFNYSFGQSANNVAHSWSYNGAQIMINSPDSDPRFDGRMYTTVERDDVVYSNYRNHLVFRNLVVDESARYDDNGGYGFRVMGSQDVLVTDCEAYHAGKHHFGVINTTGFVGRNLVAAYAAPGQAGTGGASAYVSYGDFSTGLANQTSEWHNISASNMDDPEDNGTYYAFLTHGPAMGSVLLDHLQSAGANVSITNEDSLGATETITGGLIQNARLEIGGSGVLVDGMELAGPLASIDIIGNNAVLQNMLIHGTSMGSAWYQTAVLSRGTNNTLRFSTIDVDGSAGTNTCVATTNANGGLQIYGNVLLAPARVFALWAEGFNPGTVAASSFNYYATGRTFASFVGGQFQWRDISLAQWQADGFDGGSLNGDPRFTRNAPDADYHPAAGSPLIDAALLPGSLVAGVPTDFAGSPRLQGVSFDIGAYEGAGTAVQPVATATTLSLSNGILAAQVTASSGVPTGTASFFDGTNLLNSVQLSGGSASTAVSLDSTVAHSLTAAYGGDANFRASTSGAISVDPVVPVAPAPPPASPAPVTKYPIALVYPMDGQTVSGTVVVTAAIGQTLDAAGSQLWIDGHPRDDRRTTQAPYAYGLDTTQLSAGAHTLQVWGHDISNNNLLSNMITVIVTR